MNISRAKRKNRTDIVIKSSGGLNDLFDNQFKQFLRINDQEYDYICEFASDEELSSLTFEEFSYQQKKECLRIVEKLLEEYNSL